MPILSDVLSPLRRRLLGVATAAFATGCSPIRLINELAPTDTYVRTADIPYGLHPRQRLDVYVPRVRTVPAPVVVFFYGGAWRSGSRADYLFVGEALASRGIVTFVADYRLYPEVRFPDFVSDSAAAVAWAQTNAARYGADPARLFVMGHSAGAYNGAMVALNAQYLRTAGGAADAIAGFVGLAGPYDFLPLTSASLRNIFGWPDTSPDTQPIHFAGSLAPPTLLLTATRDSVVDPGNSMRLAERLRAAARPVRTKEYPSLDHRTLVGALAVPLRDLAPVLDDIATFVAA